VPASADCFYRSRFVEPFGVKPEVRVEPWAREIQCQNGSDSDKEPSMVASISLRAELVAARSFRLPQLPLVQQVPGILDRSRIPVPPDWRLGGSFPKLP